MIFGYFTLFVALALSVVAAYYSVLGLTSIFSAAVIPVIIMGCALEVGKITAAVWLHKNWKRSRILYKLYLGPAVIFLMLLTSMGIFGFLSKAHTDQNLVSGDVTSRIAIYDEKIKTAKENIAANRKQLKQMDEVVDQIIGRSTDEKGVDKANNIRRSQQRDRSALAKDIETNQKAIASLNDEAAPIRAEIRKVEAEVGPIKYIAALIYDDQVDQNLLERAVRWVIILIVIVFDPLALILILAGALHLKWTREEITSQPTNLSYQKEEIILEPIEEGTVTNEINQDEEPSTVSSYAAGEPIPLFEIIPAQKIEDKSIAASPIPVSEPIAASLSPIIKMSTAFPVNDINESQIIPASPEHDTPEVYMLDYTVEDKFSPVSNVMMGPRSGEKLGAIQMSLIETKPNVPTTPITVVSKLYKPIVKQPPEAMSPFPKEIIMVPETMDIRLEKKYNLVADNDVPTTTPSEANFGTAFPESPKKGEMYLRVDHLPSCLYKFNGSIWIEVDKTLTDNYLHNEEYIKFLVDSIAEGSYDIDDLGVRERSQIEEYLLRTTTQT